MERLFTTQRTFNACAYRNLSYRAVSVCLSVYLSVTLVHWIETAHQTSSAGSLATLVF